MKAAEALEEYRTALRNHQIAKSEATLEDVIRTALAYAETLANEPRRTFVDTIRTLTDLTPAELERLRAEHYRTLEAETRDALRERAEHLDGELRGKLDAGDYEGFLRAAAAARVGAPLIETIRPYEWESFLTDTKHTGEGLRTGYASLDASVTLPPEAVTLIASRTGHGKTALLVNLCRNMVEEYPDASFAFLSYEQTKRQVLLRFLQRESGAVLDERQNALAIHRYLRNDEKNNPELERGKDSLRELTDAGRLIILDNPYPAESFADVVTRLKDKHGVSAVFVDYLQQIPVGKSYPSRQATVQAISEALKNTAKALHVSVITAIQKNRSAANPADEHTLEGIREADDPAFDANVVLSLVNKTMAEGAAYEPGSVITLEAKVIKNRDGAAGRMIELEYDPPRQLITEPKVDGYGRRF